MNCTLNKRITLTLIVFVLLFSVGAYRALHKSLWNDELYSQIDVVEKLSYLEIIEGKINEGNNAPLFYLIQKTVTQLLDYSFPFKWEGEWHIWDIRSQLILRIIPNLCMAFSLTLIFFYFYRWNGIWWGLYALVVALTVPIVWHVWLDARHYSLWFFLSLAHLILFLELLKSDDLKKSIRYWFNIVSLLLSLTIFLGIVQIVLSVFVIWFKKNRVFFGTILILILSMAFSIFYYLHAPKYHWWIDLPASEMFFLNYPRDRAFILLFGLLISIFAYFRKMLKNNYFLLNEKGGFLAFAVGIISFVIGLLFYLNITAAEYLQGFAVQAKYFLFLAPLGIFLTTLLFKELLQCFKGDKVMKFNIILFMVGTICLGGLKLIFL